MKNLMTLAYGLITISLIGCGGFGNGNDSGGSNDTSGCSSDSECKGSRVCEYGACVSGEESSPEPSKRACGEVLVSCTCATTSLLPGQLTSTSSCESGVAISLTCGYCPGGGYAWYSACSC